MRLGDVLEQTADASIAAGPKPRWRFGRGLAVLLLLSLGILSYVHGPVLVFPGESERVVLTTQWRLGAASSQDRYETEERTLIVPPLVQSATRVDASSHMSRLEMTVATAEGIPVNLTKVEVRHAVHPGEGHRVHAHLGGKVARRANLAHALTRQTLIASAAQKSFGALGSGQDLAVALRAEEAKLADALRAHGIRLLELDIDPPELPAEFLDLAQRRNRAQKTLTAAAGSKAAAEGGLEKALSEARAQHAARMKQLDSAHAEALERARDALSRAQDDADARYVRALREAKGRQAAMRVEAKTITQNAPLEAKVLATRVEGIGDTGSALLDWVIMNRVIPQLAGPVPTSTPESSP